METDTIITPKETAECSKTFSKMWMDVGIAVPKATETRCRDGSVQANKLHVYKDYTSNPIPTSLF